MRPWRPSAPAAEAYRTQAGKFARNMRLAMPNASFIGFTGTPFFKHDHLTRRIFGGYVSRYRQSPNIMEVKPAIRVGQESMVPVRYQVQHVKVLDNHIIQLS